MLIQTNVTNWYPRHNKPVPVYRNLWLVKQECMDLDTPTMWKIRPDSDNRLPFTKVHTQLAETIFLDTNISGTFGRASKGPLLTCSTYLAPIYLWLGSWDARCFFGHVFPHIMGGISLSAVFHHFDLFKACQIYYSYSACWWWKTKEENIEKKLFK